MKGEIRALAIAADGRLVTGSGDFTARVWDLKAPASPPLVLKGHDGGIAAPWPSRPDFLAGWSRVQFR